MKSINEKTFEIILSFVIVSVFIYISYLNLKENVLQSETYYAKNEDEMLAKIESYEIIDSTLNLITSGNIKSYCIKTTRSNPGQNSMCWKDVSNNVNYINLLKGKRYYLWIKDENGNISNLRVIEETH